MSTTAAAIPASKLHTEAAVEIHLVEQLVARQGWWERPYTAYDRKLALDPEMVEQFVRATQPQAWAKLADHYPGQERTTLCSQLEARLKSVGTLEVLRRGITIVPGIRISLCAFKPASGLNAESLAAYQANILTVMRQVRYSLANENAIDIVLFVNGIPIATLELKNSLTGSTYQTAEKQYRKDRPANGEPLLSFRRGALVHFALDQDNVSMTTHLANGKTRFLPFNRGRDGGAGNPDVKDEFRIAYLYRDLDGRKAVFSRDVLLGILHRFVTVDEVEQPDGKIRRTTIWPRYHQLDAVLALIDDARSLGAGQNYLFQHSAGSGKSNTIAWAAHHLASLHDAADQPVFHTVIIVTDRVVLDRQLQSTVESFSQVKGYVQPIDGTSRQLREALQAGAKIIISTIHKFSTDQMSVLRNQAGRRFAIIIDEAHSSQSGKHADSMSQALASANDEEIEAEFDATEQALLELQKLRGPQENLSYLAFTATPKNVTLERFGRRGATGTPEAFHAYTMRQAIEEGFIIDVLRSYQTYKSYAKLEKAIEDDPRLLQRKSARKVARFIDFHETAMSQKAEVIVEHFRRHALPELGGQAKAMVVTASREHAIRTQQAIQAYIAKMGFGDVRALVAFSGEIDVDGQSYTEAGMNGFGEKELPRQFDGPGYNVLVVAEKYQTGFDQPKLVAMYIDKKLSGLQAVQTLARLNRTYPDKDRVFILDFRNEVDEIQEAFRPYYNLTHLEDSSDPNEIYNLHARLMAAAILHQDEIDRFADRFVNARQRADERPVLEGIVRQAVTRFSQALDEDRQEEFRQTLSSFLRFYSFIAQVVNLHDTDLEKLHIYGSWLKRMLPSREAPQGGDVTDDMLALEAYKLKSSEAVDASLEKDATAALSPIDRFGANPYTEEEARALSEIIEAFNSRHSTNWGREDFLRFDGVMDAILGDDTWTDMLRNNNPGDVRSRFDSEFMRRTIQVFQRDGAMRNAFLQDAEARSMLTGLMFQRALRGANAGNASAAGR